MALKGVTITEYYNMCQWITFHLRHFINTQINKMGYKNNRYWNFLRIVGFTLILVDGYICYHKYVATTPSSGA